MTRLPRWCVLVLIAPLPSALGAGDWPRFRGPTGQGLYADADLPLRWSATENVAWKTALPGEGRSSPIVHGGRVFVTTATDRGPPATSFAWTGERDGPSGTGKS